MSPSERCTRSTVYDSSSQKLWCPIRVKRTIAATAVIATSPASSRRSGRGTPGGDVQPHVVDLHRIAHPVGDGVDVRLPQVVGQALQVVAEADGTDVVARLARRHRPGLEPRTHV